MSESSKNEPVKRNNKSVSFQLRKAIMTNDVDLNLVEKLIKQVNLNEVDDKGLTVLHLAVLRGNVSVVKQLLSTNECNINQVSGIPGETDSSDNLSPLHLASSYGWSEVVSLLLSHSPSPHINAVDRSERTAMYISVQRGHHDIVSLLMAHGANVNSTSIHGYSPLYQAVVNKDEKMVKILMSAGDRLDSRHIYYALHETIPDGQWNITELMLDLATHIECNPITIHCINDTFSPLNFLATCHSGRYSDKKLTIMKKMVAKGADLNFVHPRLGNILHCLISCYSTFQDSASLECFDYFICLKECDINASVANFGSPLEYSIKFGQHLFAEKLILAGCQLNVHFALIFQYAINLNENAIKTLELLYSSGYKFPYRIYTEGRDQLRKTYENDAQIEKILDWFEGKMTNTMTLKQICRAFLRKKFASDIKLIVNELRLPSSMPPFLLCHNIHD